MPRIFSDFVVKCKWPMGYRWWKLGHKVSLLTFKFTFHMTPRFVSRHRTDVCSQEATACFTSPSPANRLPAKCFLRSPKRWRSLGARSRTLGSVVHSLSGAGPVKISDGSLGPSDCHLCGPLKNHLAGKRFVTDDEEKRSATSQLLTLTPIYSTSEYKPWCHVGTLLECQGYVRGVLV